MAETRAWDRHRDGLVPFNCKRELERLASIEQDLAGFIDTQAPDLTSAYRERAAATLDALLGESGDSQKSIRRPMLDSLCTDASPLQITVMMYGISLLGLPPEAVTENMSIPRETQVLARMAPMLRLFQALFEVTDREHAHTLLRAFIDDRFSRLTEAELEIQNLDRWWEMTARTSEVTTGVVTRINTGKLAFRTDTCILHEVMLPLGNPELVDIVCCYGDRAGFEALNPNLRFTRTTTLMTGPYCDTCMHDIRHSDDISHPEHKFFRSM